MERMWKEALVAYFKVLSRIYLNVLIKSKKTSSPDSKLVYIRMQITQIGEHFLAWKFQHWLLGPNDTAGGESEYVII
jgi:hypothetical protein